MEYNGIKSVSAYLFKVEAKPKKISFDRINILVWIFFAFIALIAALLIYFIKSEDELLLQLRKQQSKELTKNLELIAAIQKKTPEIKKEKIEKIKKEVVKKIKKKQEKQVRELIKLRKRNIKKNTLQSQIRRWENEGYKFPEIKKEIPEKNISRQISDWKKKGFDVSALSK